MLHKMNAGFEIHKAFRNGGGIAARDYPNSHIYVTTNYEGSSISITGDFGDFEIINRPTHTLPKIERVIFSPPATIVFWSDKTKTVVKCRECVACMTSPGACSSRARRGLCRTATGAWSPGVEDWKQAGIMAAMLKKAWGNAAPSMIADALAASEWNGGTDD